MKYGYIMNANNLNILVNKTLPHLKGDTEPVTRLAVNLSEFLGRKTSKFFIWSLKMAITFILVYLI